MPQSQNCQARASVINALHTVCNGNPSINVVNSNVSCLSESNGVGLLLTWNPNTGVPDVSSCTSVANILNGAIVEFSRGIAVLNVYGQFHLLDQF